MEEENKNLELYNKAREVPKEAIKPISAGRLKGKSDINPMWRIKKLTEEFGVCGFGWRYEIIRMWTEAGGDGEVSCFVHINLFVKVGGEWSEGIQGIGGSPFVSKERNGYYTSDECYKMALTDAISVSCKALGFAADVYFSNDTTKYTNEVVDNPKETPKDSRKPLPPSMFGNPNIMKWIYSSEQYARSNNRRFSLSNLIEANYIVGKEGINTIASNYEQYKINYSLA